MPTLRQPPSGGGNLLDARTHAGVIAKSVTHGRRYVALVRVDVDHALATHKPKKENTDKKKLSQKKRQHDHSLSKKKNVSNN